MQALMQHLEASLLEALMTEGELPLTRTSLFLEKTGLAPPNQVFLICFPYGRPSPGSDYLMYVQLPCPYSHPIARAYILFRSANLGRHVFRGTQFVIGFGADFYWYVSRSRGPTFWPNRF